MNEKLDTNVIGIRCTKLNIKSAKLQYGEQHADTTQPSLSSLQRATWIR